MLITAFPADTVSLTGATTASFTSSPCKKALSREAEVVMSASQRRPSSLFCQQEHLLKINTENDVFVGNASL